ncbi:hypothetical protein BOX08_gp41 [Pseudoalteromonas phage BS5]|uniref:hypothetical protein n=1 Tax=Pseudoalteromonas phage BS5 TaxID=1874539 RepID=UPI00081986BC|nr:hypothetical protein BOX08_gp41 [Pseudoalteromonas phage BS5]ANY29606.1 hypothetical protein [Pseudoalteromonas phage BS5]
MKKKLTKRQRKKMKGMNAVTSKAFYDGYKKPCLFFHSGTTYVNKGNFGVYDL